MILEQISPSSFLHIGQLDPCQTLIIKQEHRTHQVKLLIIENRKNENYEHYIIMLKYRKIFDERALGQCCRD